MAPFKLLSCHNSHHLVLNEWVVNTSGVALALLRVTTCSDIKSLQDLLQSDPTALGCKCESSSVDPVCAALFLLVAYRTSIKLVSAEITQCDILQLQTSLPQHRIYTSVVCNRFTQDSLLHLETDKRTLLAMTVARSIQILDSTEKIDQDIGNDHIQAMVEHSFNSFAL